MRELAIAMDMCQVSLMVAVMLIMMKLLLMMMLMLKMTMMLMIKTIDAVVRSQTGLQNWGLAIHEQSNQHKVFLIWQVVNVHSAP